MPFWMTVLILVTLIALCWCGGYGLYRSDTNRVLPGGILGVLGLILLVVLVIVFMQGQELPRR